MSPGKKSDREHLQQLLLHHQRMAEAIQLALDALEGAAQERKVETAADTITAALALDAARRGRNGHPPAPGPRAKPGRGVLADAVLAAVADGATSIAGIVRALGWRGAARRKQVLAALGRLKVAGRVEAIQYGQYRVTPGVDVTEGTPPARRRPPPRKHYTKAKLQARHARMVDVLVRFSRTEARHWKEAGITKVQTLAALIRNGYLIGGDRPGAYLLTGKPLGDTP